MVGCHLRQAARMRTGRHSRSDLVKTDLKRRTNVVEIFPNREAVVWFVGALMLDHKPNVPFHAAISRWKN